MATLLVIEDEQMLAKNIARYFRQHRHTVEIACDGASGLEAARRLMPDVAIVDYQLPGISGLEVIRELHRNNNQLRTVMVSGHANVAVAVDAMKAGSFDLLTKPVPLKSLKDVVDRALETASARRQPNTIKRFDAEPRRIDSILGDSPPVLVMRDLIRDLIQNEPADASPVAPILISGETGSGKNLVAQACHYSGLRAVGNFVEVNCASLPKPVLERELFGYERKDAHSEDRVSLFEAADGGTLFLDEISELDLGLQAKLLHVLENFRIRVPGTSSDRHINVRVVAATHRDLEAMARAGQFRADLLYRLRVFSVRVPPLRARGSDHWLLAQHFAHVFAQRYNKQPIVLDPSTEAALLQHAWPGNVRELSNVIERAVMLSKNGRISSTDLLLTPVTSADFIETSPALHDFTRNEELERSHLVRTLEETQWNLQVASRSLGVTPDALRHRMDHHGLYAQTTPS